MGALVDKSKGIKMDWEKSGWLQKKGTKERQGAFSFASQVYPSSLGRDLTVFFNGQVAWLHISEAGTEDEDFWNAEELIGLCKEDKDVLGYGFPQMLDEFVPLVDCDEVFTETIEKYGLSEFTEDIKARNKDLEFYWDDIEAF